ncbi:MAG: hypothetical protein DRJ67_09715 [Thermoprotei archaeon]|nr:MAG: hypothetical protein DRJ67_09715 [Thermoprotei archaeon]
MPFTIIGRGVDALKSFIRECMEAGGTPTMLAKYGPTEFRDAVLVRCYGASDKVRGGLIVDLPAEIVEKVRKRKLDAKWILEELK